VVVVDRAYKGAAAATIINTSMTSTTPGIGGTITVADDSGYPSSGKFEITIDREVPGAQEHVLISSRSGTTFTIGQRGYDDSVAKAHTSGQATCELWLSARTVQLLGDHVDDVESDPHSGKLLNNARHDLEARHTFGAALGTPVTPTDIATAGAAGTGNNPAREDHTHKLGTGAINSAGMFASGVVDAAAIATDAVGTPEIAANAVGASELADNAVDILAIIAAARDILCPPGIIVAYGDDTPAPTGWLLCNGTAVSRTTFATLFGIIGTTYGVGDGSTTFNVPDLRGRFPLGKATAGTGSTMGGTGGSLDHTHALDTSSSGAQLTGVAGSTNNWYMIRKTVAGWNSNQRGDMGGFGGNVTAQTTGAQLVGDSDTANPAFQVVMYIIRTGNTS